MPLYKNDVLYTWLNERIFDLNCEVKKENAHEFYNVKEIIYDERNKDIVLYNYDIMKMKKGVEIRKDDKKGIKKIDVKKEKAVTVKDKEVTANNEIKRENLLKSSKRLYQYAQANASEFMTFLTLTFKDNITDIDEANKMFNIWNTNFRAKCKELGINYKYLGVPEFQKRGAVHYHILTNVPINAEVFIEQKNKKGYDVYQWSYGFSSVFDLTQTDDNFNVVKYIAKYFFKDMDKRMWGHKKILKSNNLKKPQEEVRWHKDMNMWDLITLYNFGYENVEYCQYENMFIMKIRNDKTTQEKINEIFI